MTSAPTNPVFKSEMPQAFSGENLICARGEKVVFRGLSFRVEPGEALLLLGPNGSGKSSLLRLMALMLSALSGSLHWAGKPVSQDPPAHAARTHYIGHHDAIKSVLTLRENVAFWARLSGSNAANVNVALDTFNLAHLSSVPGRMLSAGQKRRANLARLISSPAPLWLLDEPTTALDKASIAVLEDCISRHQSDGGLVILSTHQDIRLSNARTLHVDQFSPVRKQKA